jgi:hypothetical protein
MADFIAKYGDQIMEIFGAVVALITLIVKFTSTDKDNTVWAKILKVLAALSLVNPDGSSIGKKVEEKAK